MGYPWGYPFLSTHTAAHAAPCCARSAGRRLRLSRKQRHTLLFPSLCQVPYPLPYPRVRSRVSAYPQFQLDYDGDGQMTYDELVAFLQEARGSGGGSTHSPPPRV